MLKTKYVRIPLGIDQKNVNKCKKQEYCWRSVKEDLFCICPCTLMVCLDTGFTHFQIFAGSSYYVYFPMFLIFVFGRERLQ